MSDDKCEQLGDKFVEQEFGCHVFENSGNLVFLIMVLLFLKAVFMIMSRLVSKVKKGIDNQDRTIKEDKDDDENKKKKKEPFVVRANKYMGLIFFFNIMEALQLDLYLSIFVNLKSFKATGMASGVNMAVSVISLILFVFLLIYLVFISSRLANKRVDPTKEEKGYV